MKKNKLLILMGSFMLILFFGLFSCQEECGPFPNKYKTVGLDWANYRAIYADTTDAGLSLGLIENDSVAYHQYAIFISPKQETYFAQIFNRRHFSLIQAAYACSPLIPETDEKIDNILIKTSKDFDVNHPSGSDLSGLFDVVVLDHVNNIFYDRFDLQTYVKINPFVPTEMTLMLREQPNTTTDYEFTIKYYQNGIADNDYFEFTTASIVLVINE